MRDTWLDLLQIGISQENAEYFLTQRRQFIIQNECFEKNRNNCRNINHNILFLLYFIFVLGATRPLFHNVVQTIGIGLDSL